MELVCVWKLVLNMYLVTYYCPLLYMVIHASVEVIYIIYIVQEIIEKIIVLQIYDTPKFLVLPGHLCDDGL